MLIRGIGVFAVTMDELVRIRLGALVSSFDAVLSVVISAAMSQPVTDLGFVEAKRLNKVMWREREEAARRCRRKWKINGGTREY